jgi:Na+-transporting NADH:ubiquinone oxidoreductase subunit C
MSERESIGRTLFVAAAVALVCSLIVSVAVTWLRPIQLAYRSVERNRAVLVAAGLAPRDAALEDRDVVDLFLKLEPRLVDLDAGRFVNADASMIAAYDFRAAAEDPEASREIAAAADIASIGRRPLLMPVYLERSGAELAQILLPVYGRGMWSTIYGYVALNGDLRTIARAWFYELGETPGIGDRIQRPEWLAQWAGKTAFAADGRLVLEIGGVRAGSADEHIDGITGATITVGGVGRLVRYWLGGDGFGPFLSSLRQER